jgi:hypothetical protein
MNSALVKGKRFEDKVGSLLKALADEHPGFVRVNVQPSIDLYNGQVKRPDFELVYLLDQEHRELIECQDRERSSQDIIDKIRAIKALSPRNRFKYVFGTRLGKRHRAALESDGVGCLSMKDLTDWIVQMDSLLSMHELLAGQAFLSGPGTPSQGGVWEATLHGALRHSRLKPDANGFDIYRGPSVGPPSVIGGYRLTPHAVHRILPSPPETAPPGRESPL